MDWDSSGDVWLVPCLSWEVGCCGVLGGCPRVVTDVSCWFVCWVCFVRSLGCVAFVLGDVVCRGLLARMVRREQGAYIPVRGKAETMGLFLSCPLKPFVLGRRRGSLLAYYAGCECFCGLLFSAAWSRTSLGRSTKMCGWTSGIIKKLAPFLNHHRDDGSVSLTHE